MKLIANNGNLYDLKGNLIPVQSDGICQVGERRFVFGKLYDHIVRNNGETDVMKMKIRKQRQVKKVMPKLKRQRKKVTNAHRKKAIIAKSLTGDYEQIFQSHTEAAHVLGLCRSNITLVIKGIRNHTGGFIFENVK